MIQKLNWNKNIASNYTLSSFEEDFQIKGFRGFSYLEKV